MLIKVFFTLFFNFFSLGISSKAPLNDEHMISLVEYVTLMKIPNLALTSFRKNLLKNAAGFNISF